MNIKEKMFISFDMWNTLISPNPEFKLRRIQALANLLEPQVMYNLEALEGNVSHCLKQTKEDLDFMQEQLETQFSSLNCWKMFLRNLGLEDKFISFQNLSAYCLQISNSVFEQCRPTFNPELVEVLREFKAKYKLQYGITSNTNFVPGQVIFDQLFRSPETSGIFDRFTFSDEELYCKPSRAFFAEAIPSYSNRHLLHVGDNDVTDGAIVDYGIEFLKVENPQDTLDKLKAML